MSIALNAVRAAVEAAQTARNAPLKPRAKGVSADLVTDADAAAEAAAVAVIRSHCPDDAILGEEGAEPSRDDSPPLADRRHRRHGRVRRRPPGRLVQRRRARGRARSARRRGPGPARRHLRRRPRRRRDAQRRADPAARRPPARRRARRHLPAPGPPGRSRRPRERARAARRHRPAPPRRPRLARTRLGRRRPPRRLGPAGDRSRGTGCPARCSSPRPEATPASSTRAPAGTSRDRQRWLTRLSNC